MQENSDLIEVFKHHDQKLNKTAVDCLTYGAIGYGVGLISQLIFKKAPKFKYIGLGIGTGIALSMNDINLFKRQNLDQKYCLITEKELYLKRQH